MQRRQSANPWASACRKAMQPPTVRVDVTVAAFGAASNATKRAKAGAFKGAGPCGPRGPRPCVIRGAKSFLSAAGRWLRPVLPRPAHQLSARIRLTRRRPRLGRRPSWTIHPMNGERPSVGRSVLRLARCTYAAGDQSQGRSALSTTGSVPRTPARRAATATGQARRPSAAKLCAMGSCT
jgi:hypothetical protein